MQSTEACAAMLIGHYRKQLCIMAFRMTAKYAKGQLQHEGNSVSWTSCMPLLVHDREFYFSSETFKVLNAVTWLAQVRPAAAHLPPLHLHVITSLSCLLADVCHSGDNLCLQLGLKDILEAAKPGTTLTAEHVREAKQIDGQKLANRAKGRLNR